VPLSKGAATFLREFLKDRPPGQYVLVPGKNWAPATIDKGTVYRTDFRTRLNRYWRDKGYKGKLSIHDMRRSFASNLATKGESIYKIAKWLGDGLEVTMKYYGHLCSYDTGVDRLD
jgi:integrase